MQQKSCANEIKILRLLCDYGMEPGWICKINTNEQIGNGFELCDGYKGTSYRKRSDKQGWGDILLAVSRMQGYNRGRYDDL
jgi:hypothetical protein